MQINVTGLYTPNGVEDRDIIYLSITNGDNTHEWQWFMPLDTGMDVGQFINSQLSYIEADVTAKEATWAAMVAAGNTTITTTNPITQQTMTIPREMNSIVCPTIPDYYALRRGAYPSLADQLGAVLNPNATPSFADIQAQVAAVKAQYPKPIWLCSGNVSVSS